MRWLDGDEHSHNKMRVYENNDTTYREVIKGYNLLKANGCEVGISCTVGTHNVGSLDEICTYLIAELNPSNIGFNILHELVQEKNPAFSNLEYVNNMILKAYQICMDKGVYLVQAVNRLRPIVEERPRVQDCGAYGKQMVVTPDGLVGPCEVFSSCGKYFERFSHENDISQSPLFIEWANRYPANFKGCRECRAIALCGGGCAYDSILNSGGINYPDERCCQQAFTFLDWAVSSILKRIKTTEKFDELFFAKVDSNILKTLYGNIDVHSEKYPLTNYHTSLNVAICNKT